MHKIEIHDKSLEDLSVSELRVLLQPRMPAEDDLFHQLSKARHRPRAGLCAGAGAPA